MKHSLKQKENAEVAWSRCLLTEFELCHWCYFKHVSTSCVVFYSLFIIDWPSYQPYSARKQSITQDVVCIEWDHWPRHNLDRKNTSFSVELKCRFYWSDDFQIMYARQIGDCFYRVYEVRITEPNRFPIHWWPRIISLHDSFIHEVFFAWIRK
jgi:hypothetical protein